MNPEDINNQSRSLASDEEISAKYLKDFCADLSENFKVRNYGKELTEEQKNVLASFPEDLKKLLQEIERIEKEEAEDVEEVNEEDPDIDSLDSKKKASAKAAKKIQKKVENQDKLKAIAGDLFIASCASTKPIKDSLEFHKKCQLGVEELNKFNKNGVNPLVAVLASGKDSKELDSFLKTQGVNINARSEPSGNSAAHFAAMLGVKSEIMTTLIENGVNLNAKNNFGVTAFDIAALKGDEKMTEFLLKNGAKSGILTEVKAEKNKSQESEGGLVGRKKKFVEMIGDESRSQASEIPLPSQERPVQKEDQEVRREIEKQERARQEAENDERRRNAEMAEIDIAFKLHQEHLTKNAKNLLEKKAGEEKFLQEALELKVKQEQDLKTDLQVKEKSLEKSSQPEDPLEKITGVKGAKISEVNINKMLHESAEKGHLHVSVVLMQWGADIYHKERGSTVLEAAVSSGNESLASIVRSKTNEVDLQTPAIKASQDVKISKNDADKIANRVEEVGNLFKQSEKSLESSDREKTVVTGPSTPSSKCEVRDFLQVVGGKSHGILAQ